MAHFAELDENNFVLRVIVINNNILLTEIEGVECEKQGVDFCKSLHGDDTRWVQTSYNNNFRANYAGIGSYYNEELDAFTAVKPYESWILDDANNWVPPIPEPPAFVDEETDQLYTWSWSEDNFKVDPETAWFAIPVSHIFGPEDFPDAAPELSSDKTEE